MVYLIRHGERLDKIDLSWVKTAKNKDDPPLTNHGKRQSKDAGILLNDLRVNKKFIIISNPWKRCIQTAIEISKILNHGKNIKKVRIHNGLTYVYEGDVEPFLKIRKSKYVGTYLSKEFGLDDENRYLKLLNDLENKYKDYDIILVTHGETIEKIIRMDKTINKKHKIDVGYANIFEINIHKNKKIKYINKY